MKTYRILSYKAKLGDGKILDDIIRIHGVLFNPWIWNKIQIQCSHKEIWTPDNTGNFGNGTCWTSTLGQAGDKDRPKENGVVCRPAKNVVFKHPERWYYEVVNVDDNCYLRMETWMDIWLNKNKGYNIPELFDFLNPLYRKQNLEKFICSGFSWAAFVLSQDSSYESIFKLQVNGRSVIDLPSPIRMTQWTQESGRVGSCIDLQTGKILYEREVK